MYWTPQPGPQLMAYTCPADIIFFGGTRGGGKSDAVVGRQLKGADLHGRHWNGIIFRRKFKDFSELRRRWDELIADGLPAERIGGDQQTNVIKFSNGAVVTMTAALKIEMINDFVGHQYTEIDIDEAPNFPFIGRMIDKLRGSLRSPHGIHCQMFLTGNPGGPGASQITQMFIKDKVINTVYINEFGESTVYIKSSLRDNQILRRNDPKYYHRLLSIKDEMLRRAWIEGDWTAFIGQAFKFDPGRHELEEGIWPIPKHAPIYCTFDYGYAKPFSFGWWWVDSDGRLYRFSENYGNDPNMPPDTGLRITDRAIAEKCISHEMTLGLRDRETGNFVDGRNVKYICDPTCFSKKPHYMGGGQGPSTIDEFQGFCQTLGIKQSDRLNFKPGDPSRILKIRQFRNRLELPDNPDEMPMMVVYPECDDFIRVIASLCVDEENPEDVDCFVQGTEVSVPGGTRLIEDIELGDLVRTPIGNRRVIKAGISGPSEHVIEVFLSNGKKLKGTANHCIYVRNKGLVPLEELDIGDELESYNMGFRYIWRLKKLYITALSIGKAIKDGIIGQMGHILKGGIWSCTGKFIEMSTEKLLLDTTSTMLTTTQTITPRKTSLQCKNCNMQNIITSSTTKTQKPTSGIKPSRLRKSFGQMQGRCTKTHQRENFRVEIVELLLRLNTLRKSIAKIAGLPGDALRRYAPFVVKSILEKMVDQNPHKRVHILAAGNYEEETVYRLTVEESHLYYANGVLVTNTDQEDHTYDEAALICMARPMSLDPNDAISAGITSDNEQTAGRLTDAGKAAWEELNKMREELEEDKANEEDAIMDLLDSFGGA